MLASCSFTSTHTVAIVYLPYVLFPYCVHQPYRWKSKKRRERRKRRREKQKIGDFVSFPKSPSHRACKLNSRMRKREVSFSFNNRKPYIYRTYTYIGTAHDAATIAKYIRLIDSFSVCNNFFQLSLPKIAFL